MRKRFRVFFSILLTCSMLISYVVPVLSADIDILQSFSLSAVQDHEKTAVNRWKNEADGKYYFFMPAGTDFSALQVRFSGVEEIEVNGGTVMNGEVTNVFDGGGEFTVKAGLCEYAVVLLRSENIPAISIETESGSLDYVHANKNNKEKATATIICDGEVILDAPLDYIKGRGNATWSAPKKPYNIKFEKKTDLFGMGKAKKWTLLALYYDRTLIKNTLTLDLAYEMGLEYTSQSKPVDLYINGDYMGTYLLCESVETGSTRVDIDDLDDLNEEANPDVDIKSLSLGGVRGSGSDFKKNTQKWVNLPNDPENITGGYLMEFEMYGRYDSEVSGFVTGQGQDINLKSPEYASENEIKYIAAYYQEAEDALYSQSGYNADGKHYSEYFDLDSFAKMYILQELVLNLDVSLTSFFMYKNADSDLFYAGPAWDFDNILGASFIRCGIDLRDPTVWFANRQYIFNVYTGEENTPDDQMFNSFCAQLFRHEDFRQKVRSVWAETVLPLLGSERTDRLNDNIGQITASSVMNAIRWDLYSSASVADNKTAYLKDAKKAMDFFQIRIGCMTKGFSEQAAYVFYDGNTGSRFMTDGKIYQKGDSMVIKQNAFVAPGEAYRFCGWNTAADGSGITYQSGESIVLQDESITLYAQWEYTDPGVTEPTTAEPTTEPTTVPPTITEPTTVPPTITEPTTVPPTITEPTTVPPTTEPTTVPPTTTQPSSEEAKLIAFADSDLRIDEEQQLVILPGRITVSEFCGLVENHPMKLTDSYAKDITDSMYIGTAFLITVFSGDQSESRTYTFVVLMDVNGDGKINSADARLALRSSAKLEMLQEGFAMAADANVDGKINSADARLILRKAAGLQ